MDTLKAVVSVANSIRFAHRNGLMNSFDNQLWCEEEWASVRGVKYNQIFFKDDEVLLQVKAGLTATVVVNKYTDGSDLVGILTPDATTTYSTFKIYEYLIDLDTLGKFYWTVTTEESSWISEWVEVIDTDDSMLLLQWTNLDNMNNTFEFDYTTTLAIANVNFNRIEGQLLNYKPAGESTVYDNQNEVSKIKANYYRILTLETEKIPRQLTEKLIIAMQHDTFLVNEVGYVAEELPEPNRTGGYFPMTAELKLRDSEGINTHDIGFDCDTSMIYRIENKGQEDATGAGTFSVREGYGVTQIMAKYKSGTTVNLKVGTSVGGEQILASSPITGTVPPDIIDTRYIPSYSTGAWTIYWDVSGGVIDLLIQTQQMNPQP